MKHFRRHILLFPLVLLLTLLFSTPALAIDSPDTLQINAVWVYRNCFETNDQMYVVDYTIDYTVNPTENASDAYIVQLMDGTAELASEYPYPYYDDGYVRGCVSFYFNADDAPTWHGSYSVRVSGNPALSWSGGVPLVSVGTFDLWQNYDIPITQQIFSERVLYMADEFDNDWDASFSLLQTYSNGSFLSEYGVEYFATVIPDLGTIAPYSLADRTLYPELLGQTYTQDYAGDLATDIASTPFDLTDLGTAFGMGRGAITAILYYAAVLFFAVLLVHRMGTYKPVMLILAPLVILGAFIGVPLQITIIIAFVALIMVAYSLFYSPASS